MLIEYISLIVIMLNFRIVMVIIHSIMVIMGIVVILNVGLFVMMVIMVMNMMMVSLGEDMVLVFMCAFSMLSYWGMGGHLLWVQINMRSRVMVMLSLVRVLVMVDYGLVVDALMMVDVMVIMVVVVILDHDMMVMMILIIIVIVVSHIMVHTVSMIELVVMIVMEAMFAHVVMLVTVVLEAEVLTMVVIIAIERVELRAMVHVMVIRVVVLDRRSVMVNNMCVILMVVGTFAVEVLRLNNRLIIDDKVVMIVFDHIVFEEVFPTASFEKHTWTVARLLLTAPFISLRAVLTSRSTTVFTSFSASVLASRS